MSINVAWFPDYGHIVAGIFINVTHQGIIKVFHGYGGVRTLFTGRIWKARHRGAQAHHAPSQAGVGQGRQVGGVGQELGRVRQAGGNPGGGVGHVGG